MTSRAFHNKRERSSGHEQKIGRLAHGEHSHAPRDLRRVRSGVAMSYFSPRKITQRYG
jgi:hypothetical protein